METTVRQPDEIERLYLDFDGFFASVEQQARPALRGRPVGVVPFPNAQNTCVIACSREAKLRGVKNVMRVEEALTLCPDLVLVPQSPDLYRRAHNALISEIAMVIPIDAVKSIDEMTCRVEGPDRLEPQALGERIKQRLADSIGPFITCSIGYAANRQLAKMACKAGKPNGNMVWHPSDMPGPLLKLPLEAIPGVGTRMERKLMRNGITSIGALLATQPKHMRKLWGNVTGERLWYALHGYDIQTPVSHRHMFGHGRVLPPDYRSLDHAFSASRLLLTKAARRLRREHWNAGRLSLYLSLRKGSWQRSAWLPIVQDDPAILSALSDIWAEARTELPPREQVMQLHVTLYDLTPSSERQLDIFTNDEAVRLRAEAATRAIDTLNRRYGRTLVSVGPWSPPPGGYAGGKISYTRVPTAEDFW